MTVRAPPAAVIFALPETTRVSLSVPLSSAARLAPPPHPVECLTKHCSRCQEHGRYSLPVAYPG